MPAPTARKGPPINLTSGRDVPWLIDTQAELRPDKVFIVWEPFEGEGRSWTYGQFADETLRYAAGLASRGFREGDYLVLHMNNCPEFLFLWFACARIGAVVVTTNTRSTHEEMAYFIENCAARAAITQPKFSELVRAAGRGRLEWIACSHADFGDEESSVRPSELIPLESLRGDPLGAPRRPVQPMLPGSVQYTSGTTARPKGVLWTQANALWGGKVTATHLQLTASDVTAVYLPLFHTNALLYSTLSTLWSGGALVLMPRFSASRFWEATTRYGCTWISTVLFPLQTLAAEGVPKENRIRHLGLGSGDLLTWNDRCRARTLGWFGMTETVAQCTMSDIEFPGPPGSMGRVSAEYEVAIRREDGSDAAAGETGRFWIRGVPGLSIFLEYVNNPDATAEAFDEDGWFDTGDFASVDAGGHLFYRGRAKDMLKVGGENVAAVEIETVVLRAPGVLEAAVVGRPDRMRDEVPVAFVVAHNPGPELEATIFALCDEALSDFKRPQEVIFVDELPKGLLDKVLKRELRERLSVADPGKTRLGEQS